MCPSYMHRNEVSCQLLVLYLRLPTNFSPNNAVWVPLQQKRVLFVLFHQFIRFSWELSVWKTVPISQDICYRIRERRQWQEWQWQHFCSSYPSELLSVSFVPRVPVLFYWLFCFWVFGFFPQKNQFVHICRKFSKHFLESKGGTLILLLPTPE